MKALVGAFNQEKALVGAFSVIVQPVVEPMEHYKALLAGGAALPHGPRRHRLREAQLRQQEQHPPGGAGAAVSGRHPQASLGIRTGKKVNIVFDLLTIVSQL